MEFQWRFNVPEGEPERWFLSRGRPIGDKNGALDRYFGVVIDITEQKQMEGALRESEMRMRLAQEAARAGPWELRLADNYLDNALRRTAELGQPLRIEFRRLLPDGSTRWFDARAERRSVSGRQVIGGLIQDITERVNQKEVAERAAKAKSKFLSNMSHELRTPMHAILGYSEICTNAVREDEGEDIQPFLNNITTAGGRLLGLLNDLLDLSKMEGGRWSINLSMPI